MKVNIELKKDNSKTLKREGNLQKRILKYLKNQEDVFYFKTHGNGMGLKGLPDIIICKNGLFLGVELKILNRKSRIGQIVVAGEILDANGIYVITNDFLEFVEIYEMFKNMEIDKLKSYLGYHDKDTYYKYLENKYNIDL